MTKSCVVRWSRCSNHTARPALFSTDPITFFSSESLRGKRSFACPARSLIATASSVRSGAAEWARFIWRSAPTTNTKSGLRSSSSSAAWTPIRCCATSGTSGRFSPASITPTLRGSLTAARRESGLPYFVMEYVEGLPIDEYCNTARAFRYRTAEALPRSLRRGFLRAPSSCHSSRHQAHKHFGHGRRRSQAPRFRNREDLATGRWRTASGNNDGTATDDARIRQSGAGPRRTGYYGKRCLFFGSRFIRAADWKFALSIYQPRPARRGARNYRTGTNTTQHSGA